MPKAGLGLPNRNNFNLNGMESFEFLLYVLFSFSLFEREIKKIPKSANWQKNSFCRQKTDISKYGYC